MTSTTSTTRSARQSAPARPAKKTTAKPPAKVARERADFTAFLALSCAFILILTAMALGGPILAFFDIRSLMIVLGGTAAVTTAGFPLRELTRAVRGIRFAFLMPVSAAHAASAEMISLCDTARRDGIKAVESKLSKFRSQSFAHSAMSMAIDGEPEHQIERRLHDEMRAIDERHRCTVAVLRRAADVAPAMGLIGTMIGLIQMLGIMERPDAIGPAMAVALLTTLYGAMLGHMVLAPLAARLERRSAAIFRLNTVYMLGALAIARQESPRRLELAINAYLAPREQTHRFTL